MKIWVLNQNKGGLILIDNAYVFERNSINSGKIYGIKTYDHTSENSNWTLGEYETEARALVELRKIFNAIAKGQNYYEMPQK